MAEKVLEMTNSVSKIVKVDAREDDPVRRNPDISLAKKRLDWHPEIALKEGRRPTIDYFEKLLKDN